MFGEAIRQKQCLLLKLILCAGPGKEVFQEGHRWAAAIQHKRQQTCTLPTVKAAAGQTAPGAGGKRHAAPCAKAAGAGQGWGSVPRSCNSQDRLRPETGGFKPNRSGFFPELPNLVLPERAWAGVRGCRPRAFWAAPWGWTPRRCVGSAPPVSPGRIWAERCPQSGQSPCPSPGGQPARYVRGYRVGTVGKAAQPCPQLRETFLQQSSSAQPLQCSKQRDWWISSSLNSYTRQAADFCLK